MDFKVSFKIQDYSMQPYTPTGLGSCLIFKATLQSTFLNNHMQKIDYVTLEMSSEYFSRQWQIYYRILL